MRKDANGREKPAAVLGLEQGISASTVLTVLHHNNIRPRKPTKKSELIPAIIKACYEFSLKY